jgi:hypothetical protein
MDYLIAEPDEVPADELSDLDLLARAMQDAMDAHSRGVLLGPLPAVSELHRVARRARRADAARLLRTPVRGAA